MDSRQMALLKEVDAKYLIKRTEIRIKGVFYNRLSKDAIVLPLYEIPNFDLNRFILAMSGDSFIEFLNTLNLPTIISIFKLDFSSIFYSDTITIGNFRYSTIHINKIWNSDEGSKIMYLEYVIRKELDIIIV